MDQTEEGVITFAQIWRVVKKSLARAAIYVVVCAVVCFAVLFTVRTVTAENTYSATITFKQSDDSLKTTLDGYKATATNKAIANVFTGTTDTTEIYETVLETLTITAYIPEAYEDDTSYVATTYTVSFNEVNLDNVSSSQQVALLDNICTELINYYSEISSTDILNANLAWSYSLDAVEEDFNSIEYLDILSELSTNLSSAKSTMSANIAANTAVNSQFATYRSTSADSNKRTANEILAQFDNLQYTISALENTILTNGITNTNATLYGTAYCKTKTDAYEKEVEVLTTLADEYQKQIGALGDIIQNAVDSAASGSSTGSTTISIDTSSYTALVEQYLSVQTQIASINRQIAKVNLYSGYIDSNDSYNAANMATTETTIKSVITQVTSIITEYNDLVAEFEENVMPSTYVSTSKPAAAYSDSIISLSMLLIVVVAVAVVAYVVAFGQTWSKMKKAGTLNEDKPAKKEKQEA